MNKALTIFKGWYAGYSLAQKGSLKQVFHTFARVKLCENIDYAEKVDFVLFAAHAAASHSTEHRLIWVIKSC
jgi:hypothetical protein